MAYKKVLVIEDHEINRKLVRSLLEIGNYHVLEAEDAQTGISMAQAHRPDLVLMDIQLPGMDGLSATRILKEDPELKGIPVIALTAYAMAGDEQKVREAGCDGYISKPIQTRNFLGKIAALLGEQQHGREDTDRTSAPCRSRIMIVDDEPLNVKVLAAKLSAERHEIIQACNGFQALEKAAQTLPALILLDIMMPDMDGYEVARRLKQDPETRDIPIIVVTALDGGDHKVKALESGAEEVLNKPVNSTELVARVNSMLCLKHCRDQIRTREKCTESFQISLPSGSAVPRGRDVPSVLLVEDNERDAKVILSHLHGEACRIAWIQDGEETLSHIQREKTDLILLDILLPGMDGFEVCHRIKGADETRNIQVVVITCLQDLENRIRGIELGADDYLIKPIDIRELKVRIKTLLKKKECLDLIESL